MVRAGVRRNRHAFARLGVAAQLRRSPPQITQLTGILKPHIIKNMNFTIEFEQEADGRWIAEVAEIPGAMVYGNTKQEASAKVQALALRVLAEKLEHQEASSDLVTISFNAA